MLLDRQGGVRKAVKEYNDYYDGYYDDNAGNAMIELYNNYDNGMYLNGDDDNMRYAHQLNGVYQPKYAQPIGGIESIEFVVVLAVFAASLAVFLCGLCALYSFVVIYCISSVKRNNKGYRFDNIQHVDDDHGDLGVAYLSDHAI